VETICVKCYGHVNSLTDTTDVVTVILTKGRIRLRIKNN
jgi:hypothetical protein